jgi:CspA family cold shock protein
MSKSTGTVKWFDNAKGYGFIVNVSGDDLFVHYQSILTDERCKTLHEGQLVESRQIQSAKGLQEAELQPACSVAVAKDGTPSPCRNCGQRDEV